MLREPVQGGLTPVAKALVSVPDDRSGMGDKDSTTQEPQAAPTRACARSGTPVRFKGGTLARKST